MSNDRRWGRVVTVDAVDPAAVERLFKGEGSCAHPRIAKLGTGCGLWIYSCSDCRAQAFVSDAELRAARSGAIDGIVRARLDIPRLGSA